MLNNDFENNLKTIEKVTIPRRNILEFYGAVYNVAKSCGLDTPFIHNRKKIIWQHGWKPDYFNIDPKLVIGYDDYDPNGLHLVARPDQEAFLNLNGYKDVHAIGLPICYLPDIKYKRIPNTLLVMPVHSVEYSDHSHWNFSGYANAICELGSYFDEIVACVHPSCFKKGYWVDDFNKVGIKSIEGADSFDKNALLRLQSLFSTFEYVTTNSFGSQLPYAALFGAKVSIFGEYCEMKEGDYKEVRFYKNNKEILAPLINLVSKEFVADKYSELFTHPIKAVERVNWAKKEVGWDSRRSPEELKLIFGWRKIDILKDKTTMRITKVYKKIKGLFVNSKRSLFKF